MSTKKQLHEELLRKKEQESNVLNEAAEAYNITHSTTGFDECGFEKSLEERFKNVDLSNREYKPGEKTYSLDEVFDRVMDTMSEHYGVDMRKFSKRYQ